MPGASCCMNGHPLTDQDQTCPICGTVPLADGFAPLPAPVLPAIPGYDVLAEVGHGGMGIVYKARHQKLERFAAIKMIRNWSFAGSEEKARFNVEAQAIAKLQHAGIVQIYEIGEWQGMPYLALEFIEGGTLQTKLAGQLLAPLDAAKLLRKIVEPIVFAHQQGIVHRDLKPANVLLTSAGDPKITDFGLAKRMDAGHTITRPDAILGTAAYMAPEQAQRQKRTIGPTADVYALGVILYEMLTGRPPFLGESVLDTIQQVLNEEPVSPRRLHNRVPRDLETICLKCLHKDPGRRYANAAELAEDLAAFEANRPIKGRPVSQAEIAWRWCLRNPLPASLVSLLTVVFLTGFGLVTWQWLEKDIALDNLQKSSEREKTEFEARQKALKKLEDETKAKQAALEDRDLQSIAANEAAKDRDRISRWQSAQRAWEEGNVKLANELLRGINAALRHWEWHFLSNRLRPPHVAGFEADAQVRSDADFSPDGKYLAYVGKSGYLALHDARTGRLLHELDIEQTNCFAFSADGKTLASGHEARIVLWDLSSLEKLEKTARLKPRDTIKDLAVNITSLAWSPHGDWLALGWDKGYAVRNLAKLHEQEQQLLFDSDRADLANLAFSADSRFVATGRADGNIEIRKLELRKVAKAEDDKPGEPALVPAHRSSTTVARYTSDGNYLITGGGDGLVKIWDARTHAWLRTHEGNLGLITSLALSSDGRLLATGSLDTMIRIWDVKSGLEHAVLRGHASAITSLSFAPKTSWLASTAQDKSLRLWHHQASRGNALVHKADKGAAFFSVAPGAQRVFIGETNTRSLWSLGLTGADVDAGKPPPMQLDGLGELGELGQLAVSADGNWLALTELRRVFGRVATRIHVWNTTSGSKKTTLDVATSTVTQMAFAPQLRHGLATAEGDGRVTLWDLDDPGRQRIVQDPQDRKAEVLALAFTSDGKHLAAGGMDREIRIWDLDRHAGISPLSWLPIARLSREGPIRCLTFSPDNQTVAFWAGKDVLSAAPIEVVDWRTHETRKQLAGHRHSVFSLAYHRDGDRLLSAGADDFLRIWDLANETELLRWRSLDRHGPETRLAFSPDGRFAISSARKAVCIWDGRPSDPPINPNVR